MSKKPHPHLEHPRARPIFDEAWGLWGNLKRMAEATGEKYHVLWRQYDQGMLPDAKLWLTILKKAKADGSLLTASDLLWFSDRLRDAA